MPNVHLPTGVFFIVLDISQIPGLPVWIAVILLVLNLFRDPLSSLMATAMPQHFKHLATTKSSQREFEQETERLALQEKLDAADAERSERQQREERLLGLIENHHNWLKEIVGVEFVQSRQEMGDGFSRMERQIARLAREIHGDRPDTGDYLLEHIEKRGKQGE